MCFFLLRNVILLARVWCTWLILILSSYLHFLIHWSRLQTTIHRQMWVKRLLFFFCLAGINGFWFRIIFSLSISFVKHSITCTVTIKIEEKHFHVHIWFAYSHTQRRIRKKAAFIYRTKTVVFYQVKFSKCWLFFID